MNPYKFRQTFEVTTGCAFPIDMLRYDACWPASEADANAIQAGIEGTSSGRLRVKLVRHVEHAHVQPTIARWASFMARVDERTIETKKL